MKPEFLSELVTKELIGSKYAELTRNFAYYSAVLNQVISVPPGFICDYESVPIFKATSKRAGVLHDLLCRIDSDPVVTKQVAADVYAEAQKLRDRMVVKGRCKLGWRSLVCFIKTSAVRIVPGSFYFHKFTVAATLEEIQKG